MKLPALTLAGTALICFAVLVGCGGDDDDGGDGAGSGPLSDAATIEYRYDDAAVPPEFHRSYELSINHDNAHFLVDIYGDVARDEDLPVPAEVWQGLTNRDDPVFTLEPEATEDSCVGGTARLLRIEDGGEVVLDLDFQVCGGINDEDAGVVDAYVQPFIDTIPDWE
jgi:hypothetical protein